MFELVGRLVSACQRTYRKHQIGFCIEDEEGRFTTRLQRPLRGVTIAAMAVAAAYILYRLFWPGNTLAGMALWPGGVLLILSTAVLLAGGFLLWMRYTLTDTELVVRSVVSRRISLEDLRDCARSKPPQVRPGRAVRLHLEGEDKITLWGLRTMEGGYHFVMLLSEAMGLPVIEGYLGVEKPKRHNGE